MYVFRLELRRKCADPGVITNGTYDVYHVEDDDHYYEGTEVTYKCDKGHVLKGPYSLVCTETGEWNHYPPR